MKRIMITGLTLSLISIFLSSCATKNILEKINICDDSAQEQISADQKKIKALKKQIAAAEKNKEDLSNQIENLKKEISEKDTAISIQGKIIGLLDDTDQTLQKSIENQIGKNNGIN